MRDHVRGSTSGSDLHRDVTERTTAPVPGPSAALLALQRRAGNAAATRAVQRARHEHSAGCGHEPVPAVQRARHEHSAGCGHESVPAVQRATAHDVLGGSGKPLDAPVRSEMEARLGADFSDVRVHTGPTAQQSAAELGARAYTSGNHVVIGPGGGDRHTLAHELVHVIQQRQGPVAGTDRGDGLSVSDPSDRFEKEAEDSARRALAAPVPQVGASAAPEADAGDAVQRASLGHDHEGVAIQRMGNCCSRGNHGEEHDHDPSTARSSEEPQTGAQQAGAQQAGAQQAGQQAEQEAEQQQPPAGQETTRSSSSSSVAELLAPHVGQVLRSTGIPLQDLEIQLLSPEQVVMSLAYGDTPVAEQPMGQAYQWLHDNFSSICGDTVNLLKDITFGEGGPQRRVETLAGVVGELRRPEDANLAMECRGHAFFVEKRGGNCRILQSYVERYGLTHSLEGASVAGTTEIGAEDFARRLQAIGDHHQANLQAKRPFETHPDEVRLFGGALFNERDLTADHIRLTCEISTEVKSAEEQQRAVEAQRAKFADAWRAVLATSRTPMEWVQGIRD